jgi:pimeloyl-ACP methyl ester carboxylesterase
MTTSTDTTLYTHAGLRLAGTLVAPDEPVERAIVLAHGGGATREEGGYFGRLAEGLALVGVASLRFDLRGHGESDGRQEDLTLSAVLNDFGTAVALLLTETGAARLSLLGTGFSGGIAAYFAAQRPGMLDRLVLANPLLNYKKRFIDDKSYFSHEEIDDAAGRELAENGFIADSPTFKVGRPLLNEVFWLQPHTVIGQIQTPTLLVHGTKDTSVPIESSRNAAAQLTAPHELVEVEGAQHGFAADNDPTYTDSRTREWQDSVIGTIAGWLTSEHFS